MSDDRFLLKNMFDIESVSALGRAITEASPRFDQAAFLDAVFAEPWHGLELKERMRHIAVVLHEMLPGTYREQLGVLLGAVRSTPPGFPAMVYSDFVEAFGTGDWEASVPALARFTTLASAEFAIRPFIAADRERAIAQLEAWASDGDPAVRRLASEGCRPRLPWGMRLHELVSDPRPILPILETLCDDPDESVRRSVANNLNDISKDHPDVVVEVVRSWLRRPAEHTTTTARHALRTLLKRGDRDALEILGYRPDPAVALSDLMVDPDVVPIGGNARLSFRLHSTGNALQALMVDYAIHYVKANGSTSPRVFKLRTLDLEPGDQIQLERRLRFAQLSTRTHRPGTHAVEVIVNGMSLATTGFELTE